MNLRNSLFLCAVAAALGVSGCKQAETDVQPLVTVQVVQVTPKSLTERLVADAVIFPIQQAAVVSKVAAPIKRWYVQRGAKVHRGELLATLENSDLAASVTENRGGFEQAKATYATATQAGIPAEMQKAQLDLQQAKEILDAQTKVVESRKMLFKQGALPRKDYDLSQVAYVQAKGQYEIASKHLASLKAVSHQAAIEAANGQLAQAKGKFEGAQAQYSFTEIRSPINGYVTDRPNYSGEMPANGSPLVTIMDTSSVIAKAHISQTQALELKLGDPAEIQMAGLDTTIGGKVTQISPALDPNSTTVEIWVTAKNADRRLRPGSAVKVRIKAKTADQALAVPKDAILKDDTGKQTVMVVQSDKAVAREIKTGIVDSESGLVQVTEGLKPGDQVITNQAYGLPDKTKVKIEEPSADKPQETKPAAGKAD